MSEKIYVPKSSGKEHIFPDGGSIVKLNFHAETLAEFVKANQLKSGYINLVLSKRRSPDEKSGATHYMTLDTFVPKSQTKPTEESDDAPL